MNKWTKFERAELNPPTPEMIAAYGKELIDSIAKDEIWLNSHYQVNLRRISAPSGWPCDMVHLSIKRLDKDAAHDWRHFQWIKNELVGEENEAMEIYPAESRLVDTSNQYHLWVFADPKIRIPLGWNERLVGEGCSLGSRQRDFPEGMKPKDCKTMDVETVKRVIKKEV
jgi:hypothetical protein